MRDDLTLAEVFSDPVIGALMRADRVDIDALRAAWFTPTSRRSPISGRQPSSGAHSKDDDLGSLLARCARVASSCASQTSRIPR